MFIESFEPVSEIANYLRSQVPVVSEPHPVGAAIAVLSWATAGRYLVQPPSATRFLDRKVEPRVIRQCVILVGAARGQMEGTVGRLALTVDPSGPDWTDPFVLHDSVGTLLGEAADESVKLEAYFALSPFHGDLLFVTAMHRKQNLSHHGSVPPESLVGRLRAMRQGAGSVLVGWTPDAFELHRQLLHQTTRDPRGLATSVRVHRILNVAALVAVALQPEQPVIEADHIVAASEPAIVSFDVMKARLKEYVETDTIN